MKKKNYFLTKGNSGLGWLSNILLILILFAPLVSAMAQGETLVNQSTSKQSLHLVTGKIINTNNEPIIGVGIIIKGTMNGVITDIDGNFSIEVPENATLELSHLEYESQEINVSNRTNWVITMLEQQHTLDEIVVVAYGTQKKVNLTGAIATVGDKQLKNRSAASVGHMLQGVVPGLNVTQSAGRPGAGTSLNIRGVTSINGGSPLVLVDGVAGDLSTINPDDIESISVIKDASAAAIYGARAAFGVILATTKQGKGNDNVRVSYNGRFGITAPSTSTDYETRGYYSVYLNDLFMKSRTGVNYSRYTENDYNELWARRNDKVEHPDRPWVVIDQRGGQDTYVYYGNTDWYHYLYQDERPMQNHSISVSGGTEKVQYHLSGSYYNEEGMLRRNTDEYKKYNLRAKFTFKINKWLTASNNTSYYNNTYSYPGASNANTTFILSTVHGLASIVPKNPDGTSVYTNAFTNAGVMDGLLTVLDNDKFKNKDVSDNIQNTTELKWQPIKELSIVGNYTYNFNSSRYMNRGVNTQFSQYPGVVSTLTTGRMTNRLYERMNTHNYKQANVYATFEKSFKDAHNLTVMGGFNWETRYLKDILATGYNLLSDSLNDLNLVGPNADGDKQMEVGGGQNEYALMGFFGRLNYNYKGKYLFEASARYDGTSRFAANSRWALFPSVSAAWRISEEEFFEPLESKIDNLKLRFSYGSLGNQNVGYYDYLRKVSIGSQTYLFGGDKPTTASISAPVASDLTWETTYHYNAGIDLSMFKNRLNFSSDFYIRDTKDMLTAGVPLPAAYGASSPKMNSADLRTKGYELSLGWRDGFKLLNSTFEYNVTATFSDYVTHITKYDNPDRLFAKTYYEGMKWGDMWGYRTGGLFATDEMARDYYVDQRSVNSSVETSVGADKGLRAGDIKFLDLDGDNIITTGDGSVDDPGDREIIGNKEPRYHYGLTTGFSWYNIDFSIFFQGIGHLDWYPSSNCMPFWGPYARSYATYMPYDFHKMIWSEDNPDAYYPRPRGYSALNSNSPLTVVNDRYIQNIGYCRLKNLTVGYTLPKKWTQKAFIKSLRLYFSGENLAVWSGIKSDYIDPEMAANGGDLRTYPFQKSYMFGIDIQF